MAERDAPKVRRFAIPVPDAKLKRDILDCINQFEFDYLNSLSLCKINKSNADSSVSFAAAFCDVIRSGECFDFASFFQPGIALLKRFLEESDLSGENTEKEGIALVRLFKTLADIEGISKKLRETKNGRRQKKAWAIQLVHHLLADLAVNQNYILDRFSKSQLNSCNEPILGQFADTSMGNLQVWHGCPDILLGKHSVAVVVAVKDDDGDDGDDDEEEEDGDEGDENTKTLDVHTSSFEIEDESSMEGHSQQIFSEAIVFGFLKKKLRNKRAQNFLIPTIGISKKEVVLCFYDAKWDFLLISTEALLLFDKVMSTELNLNAILALWLTINYPITCSGLTDKVVATDFKADFLKGFDDEIKVIYQKQLRFGDCINTYKEEPVGKLSVIRGGKPVDGVYKIYRKDI